jgi:hypothetical protein
MAYALKYVWPTYNALQYMIDIRTDTHVISGQREYCLSKGKEATGKTARKTKNNTYGNNKMWISTGENFEEL